MNERRRKVVRIAALVVVICGLLMLAMASAEPLLFAGKTYDFLRIANLGFTAILIVVFFRIYRWSAPSGNDPRP